MDARRPTPRHSVIKMPKVKDKVRLLKAAREKQLVTYRGVPIRLLADFLKETLQARRDWQEIFRVMKSRDLQPRLLYQQSYHLESKDIKKISPNKKILKEFIITKPVLHVMLKSLL